MPLTNDELTELLDRLLAGWENEVVEFTESGRQFSGDKSGEYVSARSNEAHLRGLASGWLVFGVPNARQVVGATHLSEKPEEQQRATKITNLLTKRRRHGLIVNRGTRGKPLWKLSHASDEGVVFDPPPRNDDDASGTERGPGSA